MLKPRTSCHGSVYICINEFKNSSSAVQIKVQTKQDRIIIIECFRKGTGREVHGLTFHCIAKEALNPAKFYSKEQAALKALVASSTPTG